MAVLCMTMLLVVLTLFCNTFCLVTHNEQTEVANLSLHVFLCIHLSAAFV